MDTFINCSYRFRKKYEERKYVNAVSLPLELGTLIHLVLELKGKNIVGGSKTNYKELERILEEGYTSFTEKSKDVILGITSLKRKYWEEWGVPDDKSGMTYDDKLAIFKTNVLRDRMESKDWQIVGTEVPFQFVYDDKVVIKGFIDRVDKNIITGELKITDYKTSKAVYHDAKIKTPLQQVIYDMACLYLYGQLPTYHEYDFVLINKIQGTYEGVCSKGYFKRGITKIDKIIADIESDKNLPKPTPLCYWCDYNCSNPNAKSKYKNECEFYSLWTPANKTFSVNKQYSEEAKDKINGTKRRLIF